MTLRRSLIALALALSAAVPASAAPYTTANFIVDAPTPELARRFGEMAEYYRREKALEWLGQEMPNWPQRCPLQVRVSTNGAGGATTFSFGSRNGHPAVVDQKMEIRGEVKQLLNSVLPHEVTHTVLAQHFGRPVPRWADEGGSVLSENDEERYSHDVRCRELLNAGRAIRLRVLFCMTEYPRDMIVLYAQGYSIASWLVEKGGGGQVGRQQLLSFLAAGMTNDQRQESHGSPGSWNEAARRVYGIDSVEALEAQWIESLKGSAPNRIAARGSSGLKNGGAAMPLGRNELRTSPNAVPVLEPPVTARGAAPEYDRTPSARTSSGSFTASPASRPVAPERPALLLMPPEVPKQR